MDQNPKNRPKSITWILIPPKKFRSSFHFSIRLWTSTFHFVRIIAFVLDFALILCWVTFCLKRPNKKEFRLIGIFRQKCEKICAAEAKENHFSIVPKEDVVS